MEGGQGVYMGCASRVLLATLKAAVQVKKRGFKCVAVTWRALGLADIGCARAHESV